MGFAPVNLCTPVETESWLHPLSGLWILTTVLWFISISIKLSLVVGLLFLSDCLLSSEISLLDVIWLSVCYTIMSCLVTSIIVCVLFCQHTHHNILTFIMHCRILYFMLICLC